MFVPGCLVPQLETVKQQSDPKSWDWTLYDLGFFKPFQPQVSWMCFLPAQGPKNNYFHKQFSSVQSLRLFVTPWTVARQASLSITNCRSLPKLMSIDSVMPSSHLILCHPFHLLPSTFPSIRVFSNESALHIRWPKYWSFSFNISPSNEVRNDSL